MQTLEIGRVHSPVGMLEILGDAHAIRAIRFASDAESMESIPRTLEEAASELSGYFSGSLQSFSMRIEPEGTDFQKRVWSELLKIPYGTTISYLELSERLGSPKAVRAVGSANGKNPIAIVIPCHRVIGRNGALIGYGGVLPRKKWLLTHEQTFHKDPGRLI